MSVRHRARGRGCWLLVAPVVTALAGVAVVVVVDAAASWSMDVAFVFVFSFFPSCLFVFLVFTVFCSLAVWSSFFYILCVFVC